MYDGIVLFFFFAGRTAEFRDLVTERAARPLSPSGSSSTTAAKPPPVRSQRSVGLTVHTSSTAAEWTLVFWLATQALPIHLGVRATVIVQNTSRHGTAIRTAISACVDQDMGAGKDLH